MTLKTKKILTLTKAEQKAIHDLYEIFNEDKSLDVIGVWDILTDIYTNVDDVAQQYGYYIEIVD